jgi:hypothetical protein
MAGKSIERNISWVSWSMSTVYNTNIFNKQGDHIMMDGVGVGDGAAVMVVSILELRRLSLVG